jgi:hypothetical protein
MSAELTDLYARYQSYVGHSPDADSEGSTSPPHEFSESQWGEPLTFEEFKTRWKRICRDPALQRLWEQRLHAGGEHETRAVGGWIDRLRRGVVNERSAAA